LLSPQVRSATPTPHYSFKPKGASYEEKQLDADLLCSLLLLNLAGTVLGQGTTSRVTGTVLDQSGAAVPKATVTLTNEGTQTSLTTETTDAGVYSLNRSKSVNTR
jgi:hypothetical protein